MILTLLKRLEKNTQSVFSERELVNQGASAESLRTEGLIHRLPGLREGESIVDAKGRLLTVVTAPDGLLEAIDEDDQTFDPVPAHCESLTTWQVDIAAVSSRLALKSNIAGPSGWLDDRIYQVGEVSGERAVILAFLPDDVTGVRLLKQIRSLAPAKYRRFDVLTPSWTCPVAQLRQLELDGVFITRLAADDPFLVQFRVQGIAQTSDSPEFEFRDGFRWVKMRGREFPLPIVAAKVVEMLFQAHTEGRPDIPWKTIASGLSSQPKSMSDVFKTVPDWKQLIKATRRGLYRLNLGEPRMSSSG